jgi:uncharacterized protein YggU (UPF0235/DUF167 family)
MRVNVRVYPAARQTKVGGRYGTADPPVLIVRVNAPAVSGRANVAVVKAMALAFTVRPAQIELVAGASSRNKLVDVAGADPTTLAALLRQ